MDAVSKIQRAVDSSLTPRNKRDLIMDFADRVSASGETDEEWCVYVEAKRTAELDEIIAAEGLKPQETKAFIAPAFRDGRIHTTGTAVTRILGESRTDGPDRAGTRAATVPRRAAQCGRGESRRVRGWPRVSRLWARGVGKSSLLRRFGVLAGEVSRITVARVDWELEQHRSSVGSRR
jgi:hypothetical protein